MGAKEERPNMLEHALEYWKAGLPVFPVIATGKDKTPLVRWKQFQTRMPTEDEIRSWWTNCGPNIGIGMATGKLSGISVVDVDTYKGGDTSFFPVPTMMAVSGGGGHHFFYRHLPGVTLVADESVFIDVRGQGGYIVLPPTLHKSGNRYRWELKMGFKPEKDFPIHLFDFKKGIFVGPGIFSEENKVQTELDRLLKGTRKGGRNTSETRVLGYKAHDYLPHQYESLLWEEIKQWNQKNDPPMKETRLRKTFDSIIGSEREKRKSITKMAGQISKEDTPPEIRRRVLPSELGDRLTKVIEEASDKGVISFGYPAIDEKLVGLMPGELMVVSGATGLGKTTYCLNMVRRAAKSGIRSEIIALESTLDEYIARQCYFRIGQMRKLKEGIGTSNYSWRDFRVGKLKHDPEFLKMVEEFKDELRGLGDNLAYMDQGGQLMTVEELTTRLDWLKSEHGVRLVLVDHLHYLRLLSPKISKADFIESAMMEIKNKLIDTGMSMLLVSHVRKGNGKKTGYEDLKDSISIAQVADHVMIIDRPRGTKANSDNLTQFRVDKTRSIGGEGVFSGVFDHAIGDYVNLVPGTSGATETDVKKLDDKRVNLPK